MTFASSTTHPFQTTFFSIMFATMFPYEDHADYTQTPPAVYYRYLEGGKGGYWDPVAYETVSGHESRVLNKFRNVFRIMP